jgi:hypothetical protein
MRTHEAKVAGWRNKDRHAEKGMRKAFRAMLNTAGPMACHGCGDSSYDQYCSVCAGFMDWACDEYRSGWEVTA